MEKRARQSPGQESIEAFGAGARSADLQEGRLLANKLQTEADTDRSLIKE